MAEPQFIGDGFFWESRMAGFLTYTTDSGALLPAALRHSFWQYGFTVAGSLLARPQRLRTVMSLLPGVLAPGSQPGRDVPAELLSFGVLREFRRGSEFYAKEKIHVALELLHRAFAELRARGARQVKIFIQPEEVNPFIHDFYRREGFRLVGDTRRLGVACTFMVRDL